MSQKPVISLFIPHLLAPLIIWHKDFSFVPECKNIPQLFKVLETDSTKNVHGLSACLLTSLSSDNNNEIPLAKNRILSKNNSTKLICADPVHLEVGMNDMTLSDVITDITEDGAVDIMDTLNQHFKNDGLNFIIDKNADDRVYCYVESSKEHDFHSIPLENAMRQNIQGMLPESEGLNWKAIQNEVQMLLHSSPINQQREIAGLPTINSLWFWGGGKTVKSDSPYQQLLSRKTLDNQTTGNTYAKMAACTWKQLPDSLETFATEITQDSCIILDQLFLPAIHDDVQTYQKILHQLDNNMFAPLLRAWKNNQIEILINSCDGLILKPQRPKSWAFWHKAKSLLEIAQQNRL